MSPKHLELSQSSVESCTLHLLPWRPFQTTAVSKTLDSSTEPPDDTHSTPKRPCLSDRSTAFSIEAFSRLSIADEDSGVKSSYTRGGFRPVERKRRRRGSRSVSGRSSDRSGTLRCCSVNAQVTTCSEFQFAVGGTTDSSGELFCEANWSSDVSEAARNSRRDRDFGEKEGGFGLGFGIGIGVVESMGNESGYGSEPGYRGDAEIGYGDEFDEEEEDSKPLFWGDTESSKEICDGEKKFSDKKSHYRCRRGRRNDYNKAVDFMTHDISLLHLQPHRFDQNNGASSGEGCQTRVR